MNVICVLESGPAFKQDIAQQLIVEDEVGLTEDEAAVPCRICVLNAASRAAGHRQYAGRRVDDIGRDDGRRVGAVLRG